MDIFDALRWLLVPVLVLHVFHTVVVANRVRRHAVTRGKAVRQLTDGAGNALLCCGLIFEAFGVMMVGLFVIGVYFALAAAAWLRQRSRSAAI